MNPGPHSTETRATPTTESPSRRQRPETESWNWLEESPGRLAAALLFGGIFGFLLQKAGVAKFDILAGVLLLENFVVVKVMLAAIIVGMVGTWLLRKAGVIELHISETRYGGNIIGGLLFGVGFGLLAYCPGTNAAAVGQGNLDALVGVVGLLLGSYLFALTSRYSSGTISRLGNRGKITLPGLLGVSTDVFVPIAALLLIGVLFLMESLGL
ncbi:putative inner membrane protein [Maioricimonas rarisocia]|uniref:Putative inner membrane protein n=1 Tax=Maioricimonas rarisocia TaxID=2528026 RepID=A0A517Z0K9_9PLAN|nr:YeeE/YedE thiosulfate transporter family protein [Maioricimonas rarisocia]QDU35993.1 putative inner membrane protein [Maioricimonas rarisocia]